MSQVLAAGDPFWRWGPGSGQAAPRAAPMREPSGPPAGAETGRGSASAGSGLEAHKGARPAAGTAEERAAGSGAADG